MLAIRSAANNRIKTINIKGKITKNQATPLRFLLHKKFKNQVQRPTKKTFTTIEIIDACPSMNKILITEKTKYTIAGVHKDFNEDPTPAIIYILYILFSLNRDTYEELNKDRISFLCIDP
jgi:hypothetical protein